MNIVLQITEWRDDGKHLLDCTVCDIQLPFAAHSDQDYVAFMLCAFAAPDDTMKVEPVRG